MLVLAVGHRSQQGQLASMVLSGKQGLALPVPGFGSSAGDESGDAGSYSGNSSGADDEGAAPGRGGAASDGGGRRAAAAAASAQATLGAGACARSQSLCSGGRGCRSVRQRRLRHLLRAVDAEREGRNA